MSWRDDVLNIVEREWAAGEEFTLAEVYRFERELAKQHPGNRHVRDKIRQLLQVLRDEGRIAFEDNRGSYRRRA